MDDKAARLLSLTENLERADLTPVEEARAFTDYLDWDEQKSFESAGHQSKEFANNLRILVAGLPITRQTIEFRLHLLHLPEKAQTKVEQGSLGITHAEIISRLCNLWKSRTNGFTEDQKDEQRDSIKAAIHEVMMDVVEVKFGKDKLAQAFLTLEQLCNATSDDIQKVKGIGKRTSEFLAQFFNRESS